MKLGGNALLKNRFTAGAARGVAHFMHRYSFLAHARTWIYLLLSFAPGHEFFTMSTRCASSMRPAEKAPVIQGARVSLGRM